MLLSISSFRSDYSRSVQDDVHNTPSLGLAAAPGLPTSVDEHMFLDLEAEVEEDSKSDSEDDVASEKMDLDSYDLNDGFM
jgi:hypothetical protein